MKLLFIVPYPRDCAPSQRLKFEQYIPYLEGRGIKCDFAPFVSKRFWGILYKEGHFMKKALYTIAGYFKRYFLDFARALRSDAVYLHLEAMPFGPPVFEWLLKLFAKPVIFDIDDIVYMPHSSRANRAFGFLRWPQKTNWIIKNSTRVVVVTRYLEDYTKKLNKNVTYIPPTINTDWYILKSFGNQNKKVCLGWSGSHSTTQYIYLIEDVLRQIQKRFDIRIKVVGDRNFKIEGLNIEAKDWKLEKEVEDLRDMDIGLYPLPKNEWVLGKGGLKALQYMGVGVVPVCTRYGAVLEFIKDESNGFLAGSETEWIEKISRLIEEPELRNKIGLAARETVEEKFSLKMNAPRYLEVLKRLC